MLIDPQTLQKTVVRFKAGALLRTTFRVFAWQAYVESKSPWVAIPKGEIVLNVKSIHTGAGIMAPKWMQGIEFTLLWKEQTLQWVSYVDPKAYLKVIKPSNDK